MIDFTEGSKEFYICTCYYGAISSSNFTRRHLLSIRPASFCLSTFSSTFLRFIIYFSIVVRLGMEEKVLALFSCEYETIKCRRNRCNRESAISMRHFCSAYRVCMCQRTFYAVEMNRDKHGFSFNN